MPTFTVGTCSPCHLVLVFMLAGPAVLPIPFLCSVPANHIYIFLGEVWFGFGFGFPIFISPSKVSMREREHDRDLLPLDVNYALLDSLENRPAKGLSGNLSPSYSLCAYQLFLECSLFIIWLFIDFRSPPPRCTLHKNSHLCALFPASAPAPRPLLDKTIIVVVCINLYTQYAKLINWTRIPSKEIWLLREVCPQRHQKYLEVAVVQKTLNVVTLSSPQCDMRQKIEKKENIPRQRSV